MAQHIYSPILGKRIRVTALDQCGAVAVAGTANSAVVADGFITVNLSAEVDDGAEIIVKKADGSLCINEKLADSFKRLNVGIQFCGVNPALLAMVSNAQTYVDAGLTDIAGITVGEGAINERFALELWTGLSGAACVSGASFSGGYLLLPQVIAGTLGDVTVDGENAVTFSLTGAYTKGANAWGVGPYNVLLNSSQAPVPLPTAVAPSDHMLLIDTAYAPPAAVVDPVPMPPYITSLSPATGPIAGGTVVTATGVGFTGATAFQFGGVAGTAFSVLSDTQVRATTPASTAGLKTVTVVKTGGNAVKANAYTYV